MATSSLKTFAPNLSLLTLQIVGNIDEAVRKVALAIDQTVVMATPVDTGRARSNWLVNVGSARTDVIDAYFPGGSGSTAPENINAALEQAKNAVAGYTSGSTIYISNNLPYIGRLNEGWSRQAPAGYVLQAVQAASAAVGRIRVVP